MGDVVDLHPTEWLEGEAECFGCGYKWRAVTPVGTITGLECGACGRFTGALLHEFLPEIGWECSCGCDLFRISPDATRCANCGKRHTFDDED